MTSKRPKREDQTFLDLPSDLLQVIISRLSLKDNIRASAVSKTLHEACVSVRVAETSPWLIYFSKKKKGSCELYDPSMQKSYNPEFPELARFRVCYSKDGWLLMYNPTTWQLHFFNPFTRDCIHVPSLRLSSNQRVAFSCAPTSTSCLLFTITEVLRFSFEKITTVKTCSPNAKEWTSHVFKNLEPLPRNFVSLAQIVFANGVFFCLSESAHLLIVCPSLKKFRVLPDPPRKDSESNRCFMTEHQGKMFLIYIYKNMNPIVLKLDNTSLGWTEVKTLGGLTINASAFSSETRAEQNQPIGRKNCLCLCVLHRWKRTCLYYKVDERSMSRCKWKQALYENIWITPPLNLLDLPFV